MLVARPKMSLSGLEPHICSVSLLIISLRKEQRKTKRLSLGHCGVSANAWFLASFTRCNTASVLHGRGQLLRHRIFLTLVTCFSHDTNSSQSPKTSQNIHVRDRDWFIMSRKCVSFWWKYSSSSSKLFDLLRNPPVNFFSLFPIVKLSDFVLYWVSVFLRD